MDGLRLSETAERLFWAACRDLPEACPTAVGLELGSEKLVPTLGHRVRRRALFVTTYQDLVQSRTAEISALVKRIGDLERDLADVDLEIDALSEESQHDHRASAYKHLAWITLLAVPGLVGFVIYTPAYFSVRWIALRYSAQETDITATVKLIAGSLLFPLTWAVAIGAVAYWGAFLSAIVVGLLLVVAAVSAVALRDRLGALSHRMSGRKRVARAPLDWMRMRAERAEIAECMARILTESRREPQR